MIEEDQEDDIGRLVGCPPIHPTEIAAGYASRLAAFYGSESAYEFCRDFSIDFRGVAAGRIKDLARLAALTGANLDDMVRVSPRATAPSHFTINGEELIPAYSLQSRLHVCPECVAEDIAANPGLSPDAAVWWRRDCIVAGIDTCAKHHRPFVFMARREGWGKQYDFNVASAEISEWLEGVLDDPVRREPSPFQAYLVRRLEGNAMPIEFLSDMPLYAVIMCCLMFGKLSIDGGKTHWRRLPEQLRHDSRQEGFAILSKGRPAIVELLWRRLDKVGDQIYGGLGVRNLLGAVFGTLNSHVNDPTFDRIRKATIGAAFEVVPVGPEDPPVLKVQCTRRRAYHIAEAEERFGLARRTFRNYALSAGVARKVGTGQRIWIDSEKADEFFGRSGGFVGMSELEGTLGITLPVQKALIESKLLPAIEALPGRDRIYRPVRQCDLDALMKRFLDRAETIAVMPSGAIRLAAVQSKILGALPEVHRLVLDGQIWLGSVAGRKPYESLVVKLEEVRAKLPSADQDLVDITEFVAQAGIQEETVRALIGVGVLTDEKFLNPKTGIRKRVFRRSEAQQFRKQYITLKFLAQDLGRNAAKLFAEISVAGVRPTFTRDRFGATIFLREQLRRAGFDFV